MSMDPGTMQLLLSRALQSQPQQQPTYGGGMAGPQMLGRANPLGGAADMMQKIMLMRALQQRAPGTPMPPTMTPGAIAPQTMNAMPMAGGAGNPVNA